jgi:hypothetical protein
MLRCMALCAVIVAATVLVISKSAHALTLSANFTGTISSLNDPTGFLAPATVGTSFSVGYTVDTDGVSALVEAPSANATSYRFFVTPASPGLITASVAGLTFSSPLDVIIVGDNVSIGGGSTVLDYWSTSIILGEPSVSVGSIFPYLIFSDSAGTRLTSQDLFGVVSLDGWSQVEMGLVRVEALGEELVTQTLATGTLYSTVPEPTTALLLTLGLAGLGMRRRR